MSAYEWSPSPHQPPSPPLLPPLAQPPQGVTAIRLVVLIINLGADAFLIGIALIVHCDADSCAYLRDKLEGVSANRPLTRFLAYFAVADALTSAFQIANQFSDPSNDAGCQLIGALANFAFVSGWLWMIAIANLLRRQLTGALHLVDVAVHERLNAAVCFGVPALEAALLLVFDFYGGTTLCVRSVSPSPMSARCSYSQAYWHRVPRPQAWKAVRLARPRASLLDCTDGCLHWSAVRGVPTERAVLCGRACASSPFGAARGPGTRPCAARAPIDPAQLHWPAWWRKL